MNTDLNDLSAITVHNWWRYQDRFEPPLTGPYDVRLNTGDISALDFINKVGIPRLLMEAKYREQMIGRGKSLFALCPLRRGRHEAYWQSIMEDEERLAYLKDRINKIIA